MITKWDRRFLQLAQHIAGWSKDASTKVGAVIVRPDRTIASLGFNGFPRGVVDSADRLHDRDAKLAFTVHAELNAVLASHVPVRGYSLYVTLPPCDRCAAHLIQSGIIAVAALTPTPAQQERWGVSFKRGEQMFREAGVSYWTFHPNELEEAA